MKPETIKLLLDNATQDDSPEGLCWYSKGYMAASQALARRIIRLEGLSVEESKDGDMWECPKCYSKNNALCETCKACGFPRSERTGYA